MSKKLIIPIVVFLLLAVTGFVVLKKAKPVSAPTNPTSPTPSTSQSSSLLDLFKGGKNLSCEINRENTQGTVKISGDKSRVDMTSVINDKTVESHVIVTTDYMYMWNSTSKDGFKFKNEPTPPAEATTANTPGKFDLNQQVDFKCSPWTVDSSVFNLPTDIKFSDLSQTIKKVEGAKGLPTSACDQITDPSAKAACLSALKP